MLRNTCAFLQIPVFYLYVLSVCYSDFKLKPKYLIHLLPFLIANIALLPRFYTVDTASKKLYLENNAGTHINSKLKLVSDIISEEKNNNSEAVNENVHNEELLKLKKLMTEEKPFLNPSLTIQDISKELQIPVCQLSIICNNRVKKWGIIILLNQRNSKMRQNLLNEIYDKVLK